MLMLGQVHTGLLQHSTSLSAAQCERLLGVVRGERVRRFDRPIAHAVSPDLLTGVDCQLPTGSRAQVRAVGTVSYRATVTGGHLLQGSAVTSVSGGSHSRQPWAHYLANPGRLEPVGKADLPDLARGFASATATDPHLNLGAISDRMMDTVQSHGLDRRPPLRSARTRLRWAALSPDHAPAAGWPSTDHPDAALAFRVEDGRLRTLRLRCEPERLAALAELCEDLARHDWLLTTLLELIERSQVGSAPRAQTIARLRPAIDHLLHLWMPAARVDDALAPLWESLERRPGFSRQWTVSVNRIRDQLALSAIARWSEAETGTGLS